MTALTLNLHSALELIVSQFYELCQVNRDLKLERAATGAIIIMLPARGKTGSRNIEISFQVQAWSRQNNLGIAFDSFTGFKLPNGAERAPDVSWIKRDRWNNLSAEQKRKFPPLCPDFVIELRSETDSIKVLRLKM